LVQLASQSTFHPTKTTRSLMKENAPKSRLPVHVLNRL
jgi:hypothetical protein